ncbi:glycosyltransferase [Calothrix sp. CCY 0018]|uniref:glycosyltransferase n=1 Tax=Calothrix sp. CCY 0018 TaxID=3103864 RepID=UPI0039C702BC
MQKPTLTIFYQFNPWNPTIGGIQTLIKIFIKYAPSEFEVRLVGTGDDPSQPVGKWVQTELAGKEISFLPLFNLQNDNHRNLIPTSVKYTAALIGRNFASDFMHFHRLEPTLFTRHWQGEKMLFIHNDIQMQMKAADKQKSILWRRFPQAYFALEKLLVGQFSQILSCNTDAAELFRQRYPNIAERVTYIKNSFDPEIFYPLTKEEQVAQKTKLSVNMGLAEETSFVLFAGRLHPQKDPILLLRAFASLKDLSVHLLIAGDGELATEVRAEINRLGLSERVTMLGVLNQKELAQFHQISSVFVLSSAYEGLPLVVLEALACGTPVVTTRCGETPKLLTPESGLVCEERNPVSIADALRRVLLNPEDYPMEFCVQAASPYAANTVVNQVYNQMWQSWEQRNKSNAIR